MERKHNSLMFFSFLAYYIILFAERMVSIVWTLVDTEKYGFRYMFFHGAFNKFAYGMTFLSLAVFLIIFLRIIGKGLAVGIAGSWGVLIFDAGVLLVAGMQETANSFTVVQFIAYIFLFIACFVKFLEVMRKKDATASTIASFVYFVGFGLAIPVVHRFTGASTSAVKYYYLFEAIASCGLCLVFTIMMLFLFSEERYRHVNNVTFLALLVVADALVLFQGFRIGAPNLFMAGALGVAVIGYIVTVILLFRDKRAKIL